VVIFGVLLIRSVIKEVRQREKMEQMAKELEKAYGIEKEARVKIQELGEAKTQFIMATQHHLRTPLTSMRGYIDLILTGSYGKVPPKVKNAIFKLQISTVRLLRIVNELLDVSQFQLGKKVVSLQPGVQIEPILKEVIEELRFTAETKGIYLKFQEPEEKMPAIQADVEKLKVVLFNLIDNGLKYTNKGGVTIKLQVSDGKVRIISEDTGIGIPKERLGTLFDSAFERGQEAKKVFSAGRGIGLYVSSQIIKAHNGRVWAESEGAGKGTTFYVELPVG
jgi:signal transduction histidine kinase